MATGSTNIYNLPYPVANDPVNVHEDIQALAEQLETVLPSLGLAYFTQDVRNESGTNISKGDPVYISGYSSGQSRTLVVKSDADDINTFPVIGLAEANIANNTNGAVVISGVFSNISTASFSAGDILYVADGGGLTATQPAVGSGAVGVVAKSDVFGVIIVGQPKGNGTWGSLKAGLA
jgi:hypothetical protein